MSDKMDSMGQHVHYGLRTHLEMLRDHARCNAYKRALGELVRDRVVLDVGCGSGILSFFAARAGAKRVLAVDKNLPPDVEKVARINGLDDRVSFFSGRIEDIELPVDSVDVIVSEWMGGLLLMEDMLPVVLYARDRWLKPGGLMLPDRARLFLVPLDDVAGVDAERYPGLRKSIGSQMWVSVLDPARFLSGPTTVLDLDLESMDALSAAAYESAFRFEMQRDGTLNGFGLWFDVLFTWAEPPVLLTTAPWQPPTHWAQGLWILNDDVTVSAGDEVAGTFSQTAISPSTAFFKARVRVRGKDGERGVFTQEMGAGASNMNAPGATEEGIMGEATGGGYRGRDCLWVGCSMSWGALAAARHGAGMVTVLNHSPWAGAAMRVLAREEGLTNVRFISTTPGTGVLTTLQKNGTQLLGSADASWAALVSHIQIRRVFEPGAFRVRFLRHDSSWGIFHGFDFSPFAVHDLEMYHEMKHETYHGAGGPGGGGVPLEDITESIIKNAGPDDSIDDSIVYSGRWTPYAGDGFDRVYHGEFNRIGVDFNCGAVVLPLPKPLTVEVEGARSVQRLQLTVSLRAGGKVCRFSLEIGTGDGGDGETLFCRDYDQPTDAMGHIVHPDI